MLELAAARLFSAQRCRDTEEKTNVRFTSNLPNRDSAVITQNEVSKCPPKAIQKKLTTLSGTFPSLHEMKRVLGSPTETGGLNIALIRIWSFVEVRVSPGSSSGGLQSCTALNCQLYVDRTYLHHVGVRHPRRSSQHVGNGCPVAADLVEQWINTCKATG